MPGPAPTFSRRGEVCASATTPAAGASTVFVVFYLRRGFSIMPITPDTITPDMNVAAIATAAPGTIRVFQEHEIDFCCGGKIPLSDACRKRGLDVQSVL